MVSSCPLSFSAPTVSIEDWVACFDIFRTLCLIFDIVSAERLDQYKDKIVGMARRYGPRCWPLVYQIESRTRSEHAGRVRRRLALEKTEALENGTRHPYNPLKPWEEVFAQLTLAETEWWNREVHQPCTWICGNVVRVDRFLHGDAPVASSSTLPCTTSVFDNSPGTQHYDAHPSPPARREKRERGDDKPMKDGRHTHNRSNTELCAGYNDGTCNEMGAGSRCKRTKKAHQCSICLSNTHGACDHDSATGGAGQKKKRARAGRRK